MSGTMFGEPEAEKGAQPGAATPVPQTVAWHVPDLPHRDPTEPIGAWRQRYRSQVIIGDFAAALIACSTAALVRWGGIPNLRVALLATVVPVVWLFVVAYAGGYRLASLGIGLDEYHSIGRALVILLALVAVVLVSLGWQMSRLLIGVAVPLTCLLTVVVRWLMRGRLAAARAKGRCLQPTIVVGRGLAVPEMIAEPTMPGRTLFISTSRRSRTMRSSPCLSRCCARSRSNPTCLPASAAPSGSSTTTRPPRSCSR